MSRRSSGVPFVGISLALLIALFPAIASAANSPVRPISWLAAGDSYSSGQGLPHATGPCAQASGVGSATYAKTAYADLPPGGPVTPAGPPILTACGGAPSNEFFAPQDGNPAEWTGGRFDLITFTFGGDDVDFPDVLKECIGLPVGSAYVRPDAGHSCPSDAVLRQRIQNDLTDRYRSFLTQVADQAVTPGGNVVVLGYPELIEDPNLWTGLPRLVGVCAGIGPADAYELRGLAGDLNATIGEDVTVVNAQHPNGVHLTFVDVNSGGSNGISRTDVRLFEPAVGQRHNVCAADSWINGLTTIDYTAGSFHPKQAGQDAEGSMLAEIVDTRLDWSSLPA